MSDEKIVGVAIRHMGEVVVLLAPNRHHDLIAHLRQTHTEEELARRPKLSLGEQGFWTSFSRFLTRREAREVAVMTGQCTNPAHATDLFSEDLW